MTMCAHSSAESLLRSTAERVGRCGPRRVIHHSQPSATGEATSNARAMAMTILIIAAFLSGFPDTSPETIVRAICG
jgi:hypothetical protein